MIRWLKRFVYFALLLVILLPVTASAQSPTCPPTCYASYDGTADCNDTSAGTYDKQWKAADGNAMLACFNTASTLIDQSNRPGTFYWARDANHYWAYKIDANGKTYDIIPSEGVVPVTGVDLPFSTLLIGLALLGVVLLVAGYLLRSRLFQASRP